MSANPAPHLQPALAGDAHGRRRPRTRLRARWLLVPLAATALLAAACGGDSGGGSGSGSSEGGGQVDAADCPVKAVQDATAPIDVTVWHAYVGLQKSTLEQLATSFNGSQNKVKVSVEAQGTYEELLKKYEDALGDPGTLPDMILTEDTTTQFMIDSGAVVPAQSCIEADDTAASTYDDVLPSVKAAYTVDDVLWPGAFSVSSPIYYANNAILRQAGVDTSTTPKTLDDVRAVAEKVKAANVPGVQEPLVMKVDAWYLEHWLTGVKKPIVNENNGRAGLATTSEFDNPTTRQIMEWFKKMVDDKLLKPIPSASTGIDEYLAINNKTSAMLIQTSTAITTVAALLDGSVKAADLGTVAGAPSTVNTGLDIGVGPVPGVKEAGKGQIGGSAWYLVTTNRKNGVGAAWQFMKYFLQTPNQVTWTEKASYLPVLESASSDPSLQQFFTGTTAGKWLNVAYEGLGNLDPDFPGPVIGPYKEFRSDVREALDGVALTGTPVNTAVSTADQKFQSALDAYAEDVGG